MRDKLLPYAKPKGVSVTCDTILNSALTRSEQPEYRLQVKRDLHSNGGNFSRPWPPDWPDWRIHKLAEHLT
jgi:hypothetical protein